MKKYVVIWLLLFSLCSFANAQTSAKKSYTFIRTNGRINPGIKGYWKSIGNGYILDASSDSILLYSYTASFCYKEKNDYAEQLLNTEARFKKGKDTISVLMTDYGDRSEILQIKNDFVRINNYSIFLLKP